MRRHIRLTDQKGFDLIAYIMDELCQDAVQIVVLGTGEERYENMFRQDVYKRQGNESGKRAGGNHRSGGRSLCV